MAIIWAMGFPEWTLWGMGSSLIGALFFLILALLGQSPGILKRVGFSGARLDLRVRAFTGYAFALLLLLVGFFLAGVPLGAQPRDDTLAEQLPDEPVFPDIEDALTVDQELVLEEAPLVTITASVPATPETGAFTDPLQSPPQASSAEETESPDVASTRSPGPSPDPEETISPTPTPEPSDTSTATATTTPTSTSTPEPTTTPTPTLTPTPITEETAIINTDGGTVWMRRSPGGQNIAVLNDNELVIVLSGHANHGGILWQEIKTVYGVSGWIQAEFLILET